MRMAGEPPSPAEEPGAASGCEQCKDFQPAPEIQGEIVSTPASADALRPDGVG